MRWPACLVLALVLTAPPLALAQRGPAARPPAGMVERPMRPSLERFPTRGVEVDRVATEREAARRRTQAAVEAAYERDPRGAWFRRGEIVVAAADAGAAEAARALGLRETSRAELPAAGLILMTFQAPEGVQTQALFEALRAARPDDAIDLNFVYVFQAARLAGPSGPVPVPAPSTPGPARIGAMIDSGLPAGHAALEGVRVVTARFSAGPARTSAHALAVAAVYARAAGGPGLTLLAADAAESGPLPGAAVSAIARGADWAASSGARVINVSLTGPPNTALAAVIERLTRRGVVIVAAAGNEGPHARAPFPAALPGVIGVTAVDARLRIWRRATQGEHVDFAAPGVDVGAAGGRWTGTSMAAPVVAGRLVGGQVTPDELARRATDLGVPGRDPVYGHGFVAPR
ncbi:S8 family serine peptidase [Phenylobacterium sp.]|uniref:S8 family serine peptidase n=1 Tax=Phenylobacterium sp. TaxID=1871053 RepID=UPI0027377309|nr:S8 family serine peptidase [Phenylobacterium sp.]MDP3852614.1 S8 family serine peptidase [Phenylobacterium sp.]